MLEPYKGREVQLGQRVQVYRNIKKPGVVYSVRDAETGLVLGHTAEMMLTSCTFRVNQAGRSRVLREHRKNIHGWIEGDFGTLADGAVEKGAKVRYDPFKNVMFSQRVRGHEQHILSAEVVHISRKGIYALGRRA